MYVVSTTCFVQLFVCLFCLFVCFTCFTLLVDLVQKNVKEREISFDEVRKFAREKKALSMECSAKSGYNVNEMFESVISEYIKRYGISNQDNSQMNNDTNKNSKKSVKLDKGKSPNKKGGCC